MMLPCNMHLTLRCITKQGSAKVSMAIYVDKQRFNGLSYQYVTALSKTEVFSTQGGIIVSVKN